MDRAACPAVQRGRAVVALEEIVVVRSADVDAAGKVDWQITDIRQHNLLRRTRAAIFLRRECQLRGRQFYRCGCPHQLDYLWLRRGAVMNSYGARCHSDGLRRKSRCDGATAGRCYAPFAAGLHVKGFAARADGRNGERQRAVVGEGGAER